MNKTTIFFCAILTATLVLAGCTSLPGPSARESVHHALRQAATQNTPPAPPPAAVSNALLPPVSAPAAQDVTVAEHFDINVSNVPASQFFMSLVKNTHFNMVVPPKLEGTISLRLHNITVPQVMKIVRNEYGYEYRRQRNVFMVLPETLQTRIFHINYLNIVRKGMSQTRVTTGETTAAPTGNNVYGGGLYGRQGGANRQNNLRRQSTSIKTKIESDFWGDLTTSLKAIVGTVNGRQVVVNADSGVIVVRALPGELHNVMMYLDQVQGIVAREVILEAKIVEVTLKSGFKSGIDWGALGQPADGKTIFGAQLGGSHIFDLGRSDLGAVKFKVAADTPITSVPSSAFGGVFALALNLHDFSAFIELLESQGNVHVLSSPRVATLNNQQAVIKVGTDEYFVTGVRQNTYINTTTSSASNVILQPFFSGIALDVTPQINAKGEVTLHIHPTVSEVTGQQKTFTVSGQTTSLPLALSQVRESDSIVRAKSGQIIVIGGLMKTESHNATYKTPLLGDIPIIGNLFKHTKKQKVKTELVILLKPTVINNPGQWSNISQRSLHRLRAIDGTVKP